ncbi:MAG: hypothetical protein LBQ59_02655 [Candidatus Peribacteria bacterium]|nr:hypothetical protein [Candidatus Peribacteria bacterium]
MPHLNKKVSFVKVPFFRPHPNPLLLKEREKLQIFFPLPPNVILVCHSRAT